MTPAFDKGSRIKQYIILEKIHSGGKSVIYVAEDSHKRHPVALKIFRKELLVPETKTALPSYVSNFARLGHPGLVKIHDVLEWEEHVVLVMDFCEGQSLTDMLKNFEATPPKAIELVVQILEAFDYAHQREMVHGPLTPSQIIIDLDGRAKIIGFEEAVMCLPQTGRGKPFSMGPPEYAAPEVLDGAAPDKRSDLFSIGVILYELLSTESPFRGDNREESSELVRAHTPTALSKLKPELPHRLENILQRLLCKDPEHRYQKAAEVISDLKAISFTEKVAATKPPVDWWNRYVVPAAVLVLIIIAILWLMK